jgi:hypothetical protein
MNDINCQGYDCRPVQLTVHSGVGTAAGSVVDSYAQIEQWQRVAEEIVTTERTFIANLGALRGRLAFMINPEDPNMLTEQMRNSAMGQVMRNAEKASKASKRILAAFENGLREPSHRQKIQSLMATYHSADFAIYADHLEQLMRKVEWINNLSNAFEAATAKQEDADKLYSPQGRKVDYSHLARGFASHCSRLEEPVQQKLNMNMVACTPAQRLPRHASLLERFSHELKKSPRVDLHQELASIGNAQQKIAMRNAYCDERLGVRGKLKGSRTVDEWADYTVQEIATVKAVDKVEDRSLAKLLREKLASAPLWKQVDFLALLFTQLKSDPSILKKLVKERPELLSVLNNNKAAIAKKLEPAKTWLGKFLDFFNVVKIFRQRTCAIHWNMIKDNWPP